MSPPSLLRFLHRLRDSRREAPALAAGLLCPGMTPEEPLGRNLKSMIWLGEAGVGFYQLPFPDGAGKSPDSDLEASTLRRSTLKSLLWS